MKPNLLLKTAARATLLLGLLTLLGVDEVYAQSKGRAAEEANQQRELAERYYSEGQLDRAELAAMRAVELDPSSLTERARRVLIEVYLQRGELNDAEQNIRDLRDVPNLSLPSLEWTVRASRRVEIERLEGAGDAAGAKVLLDVFPVDGLSTPEADWQTRVSARVALRGFEQRREIAAGREAVAAALGLAQAAGDVESVRWLTAAERRLGVVELEWASDYVAARAAATELTTLEGQRPPDLLWAQSVLARLDVRLTHEGGDHAQARALAEAIAAREDASALDKGWAQGFLLRLDYEAAVVSKADNADELAAQLTAFWASEPPAERPPPPMVNTHRANVQFGLVGGFNRWAQELSGSTASPEHLLVNDGEEPYATWQEVNDDLACSVGCSAITLSVVARGSYALTEHLVIGGGLGVTQPLTDNQLGGVLGLPLWSPWLGVGWHSDGLVAAPEGEAPSDDDAYFTVMLGPRVYRSVLRAEPGAPLLVSANPQGQHQYIPMAQLSGEVVVPSLHGDAQVNLGSNGLTHLVELDLGYRHGRGAWSWRAGLTGGVVTGEWGLLLGDASEVYPTTMTDWRVGLGISADWERP